MSLKLTPVAMALGLLGLMTLPAWAADANENVLAQQEIIKKLTARTGELEAELKEMKKEIHQLKASENIYTKSLKNVAKQSKDQQQISTGVDKIEIQPASAQYAQKPLIYFIGRNEPLYFTGPAIVSSPYIGEYSQYNASDLVVNFPSVNLDLQILKQRNQMNAYYKDHNVPPPDSLIDLSGRVEGQVVSTRPYTGNHTSNIDLSGAEIDIAAMVNRWSMGYLAMVYDNSRPPNGESRFSNSRLFIDKGFVTFGDLGQEPIYATIGQFFVPFGQYSTSMISDPLTKQIGRIKARALQFGYTKQFAAVNLNAAVYAFRGDSKTSQNSSKINNYGANLDYIINQENWSGDLAVGYVMNIADSLGMQNNGASTGYSGLDSGNNVLNYRVPGLDIHGRINVGSVSLVAEYVTATKPFSPDNLTYNNNGAKPQAIHIEGVYEFSMWGKPSLVAVGYDTTKDALALLLPKQRYVATFSTSVWKDTIQSLEFRHDINYGVGNTAAGQRFAISPSGLGHTSNTVTLQVGVFF